MQYLTTLVLLRLLSQDNLQLQLPPPDPRRLPEPVGSIRNMEIRQSTAGNHVPCRKTRSPAGGTPRPTCWFSSSSFCSRRDLLFFPHLPEGYSVQSWVLGGLRRLCVHFSWTQGFFWQRSSSSDGRRFAYDVLWLVYRVSIIPEFRKILSKSRNIIPQKNSRRNSEKIPPGFLYITVIFMNPWGIPNNTFFHINLFINNLT